MKSFSLSKSLKNVRQTTPLIHCITNYVTVNDCANALLACGASPIMSDEVQDVKDITSICGGLVLNIGTLNANTISGMMLAGEHASKLNHPIVLDPVGAGASALRTNTASAILDNVDVKVIRGNMSEVKALAGVSVKTRGVDVDPADVVSHDNIKEAGAFAKELSRRCNAVVAITGAIDIVAYGDNAAAIKNGSPVMGRITGAGCMLSCVCAAYATANQDDIFNATVAAISQFGIAGEIAESRMEVLDGNGSFRTYLLDALYNMDAMTLELRARIEEV